MVASRLPGESDDYDRPDMALESGHRRLIEAVCRVQPNTVVVVMGGDAVEMPWADGANAILAVRYDATEIMPGVTEVLAYGTAVIVEPA